METGLACERCGTFVASEQQLTQMSGAGRVCRDCRLRLFLGDFAGERRSFLLRGYGGALAALISFWLGCGYPLPSIAGLIGLGFAIAALRAKVSEPIRDQLKPHRIAIAALLLLVVLVGVGYAIAIGSAFTQHDR